MDIEITGPGAALDAIRRLDADGEHWTGRELMPLMDYRNWEDFRRIVRRAFQSAKNSGHDAEQAFSVIAEKGTGGRPREDFRLTRFGAYLTAMNGDPNKPAVAAAQAYFAVKTREAEVAQVHQLPTSFAEALELAARQARELEAAAPMVEQAKQHRAADGMTAVPDFANKVKAWASERGVKVLHKDVWDFLGEIGLLIRGNTIRHNHPTAEAVKRDFVRLKETTYESSTGAKTAASPRLTPAGEGWAWDRAVKRIETTGSLTRKAVSA